MKSPQHRFGNCVALSEQAKSGGGNGTNVSGPGALTKNAVLTGKLSLAEELCLKTLF